eukprot:3182646-Rhodomonas_salina.4
MASWLVMLMGRVLLWRVWSCWRCCRCYASGAASDVVDDDGGEGELGVTWRWFVDKRGLADGRGSAEADQAPQR